MNEIWTLILFLWVVLVLLLIFGQYMHFKRHGRLYWWNEPEFDPQKTDFDALLPVDRIRAKNEAWSMLKNGRQLTGAQQKLLALSDTDLDKLYQVYGCKPRTLKAERE